MNRILLFAVTALVAGIFPTQAHEDGRSWERVWTSADGKTVTGKMLLYDGERVAIEVRGRRFDLPLERLDESDRRWLAGQPHQDASEGPVLKYDGVGYVQPFKLPPMPVREWPTTTWAPNFGQSPGTPIVGRLVDVVGTKVSIDTGGGRIVRVCEHMGLCLSNHFYLSRWTKLGPLERHDAEGRQGQDLRARGLAGYRLLDHPRREGKPPSKSLSFQWFAPQTEPGKKYPLVVFLHEIGERGENNHHQLSKHRDPMVFIDPNWQQQHPSFFMAPQHTLSGSWYSSSLSHSEPTQDQVMKAIWRMMTVEHAGQIDERRIYITGLSSGGLGAAQMTAFFSEIFAAAVPISSRLDGRWFSERSVRPMWFFLTSQDEPSLRPTIERFIQAIPQGQPVPKVTVFDAGGHNAWGSAYRNAEMREWLFQQVRPDENGARLFR